MIANRLRFPRARLGCCHQLEHPAFNQRLSKMVVKMPDELLLSVNGPATKQLVYTFYNWARFFAGIRIGRGRGDATLKRKKQQADLVVRKCCCDLCH